MAKKKDREKEKKVKGCERPRSFSDFTVEKKMIETTLLNLLLQIATLAHSSFERF